MPIRIEIGPRDLEKGTAAVARRDKSPKEKEFLAMSDIPAIVPGILDEIQATLLARATAFRDENLIKIDSRTSSTRSSLRRMRRNRKSTEASHSPIGMAAQRSRT